MSKPKPKLLVLTSSYPKWKGDHNGNFIHNLNIELSEYFDVFVIAPFNLNLKKKEVLDDIMVYRFKQFIFNVEFAYGTDILEKIKKNFLLGFIIPFFLINQLILLAKIVRKEKIELIQTHWIIPQAFVAVLYKKIFSKKVKIFGSILGADINSFNGFFGKKLKIFILKNLEFTTAQSNPLADFAQKLYTKKQSYYCPIGVNTEEYHPQKFNKYLSQELKINGPFLLYTATLIERKGIRYLLNAMPEIKKTQPSVKLVIIGDGILRQEMEKLALSLNISSSVIFLGFKLPSELPNFFASCDIFILPSLSEGFPLVVMCALSSGAITVVSDLPVFTQLCINDSFLNITNVKNDGELANKIIQLLNQPKDLIDKNKLKARKFAESNFNIKTSAQKFSSLFLTSLNK